MKVILLNVSFKNNIKLQKIPPRVPRLPRFPLKEPPRAIKSVRVASLSDFSANISGCIQVRTISASIAGRSATILLAVLAGMTKGILNF